MHNATTSALLRIENLRVRFRNKQMPAVNGASMTVHTQQTLAVVGESGCGKTVTALSVLQLLDADAATMNGAIHWKNNDLLQHDERRMRRVRGGEIAMIFQEPMTSLNPVYSIGDQIVEAARLHRQANARQASELTLQAMADVGIDHPARRMKQYPHEFSGGMRQRAMIAMALVCEPDLLLADEPTTALDVTTQARILTLLKQLQERRGMAIMLISHDFGVVAQNADVVCVMYGGRVVEYASAAGLFNTPRHPYTQGLLRSMPGLRDTRTRLTTVRHWIGQCEAMRAGIDGDRNLLPWWPDGPADSDASPVLRTVGDEHWVLCRGNDQSHPLVVPDIAVRRPVPNIPGDD